MKILLFGKNGQIGWELQRSLSVIGEVIALDRRKIGGDLSEPFACANRIRLEKPQVVVNAAAYTEVDCAEDKVGLCERINSTAVDEIATACAETGSLLVHYSSDYVFSGNGAQPWLEHDQARPLNVYGQTKLKGELAICASGCRHLIFRTSWVYSARGSNFAMTMLKMAQQRKTLSVISDQFGVPTGADLIADVTAHAIVRSRIDGNLSGVYHLVPEGETTWFQYAKYLIEKARTAGLDIRVPSNAIIPIKSSEFKSRAMRPLNSRLNNKKIRYSFDLILPDWKFGIDRLLQDLSMKGMSD